MSNYGTNPKITNLINNIEIWINPLSNPDGTYWGGNNTVADSRRYLANDVDANRNFPDIEDGDHPDGNAWAKETMLMMDFADAHNFVMSANIYVLFILFVQVTWRFVFYLSFTFFTVNYFFL